MLYLLLTTLCAAAIMIAMRMSNGHITSRFSMLAVNYLICATLSYAAMGFGPLVPAGEGTFVTVGLGLFTGGVYVTALSLSQYNIPRNGVVLPSVFSRLGGLMVPLALAILLFGEFPRPVQVAGSAVALAAVVVLNYDKDHMRAGAIGPLIALFFADGLATGMAKVFSGFGNPAHKAHFLFCIFITALTLCVVVLLVRRERPGAQELLYGVLVGVPNFFASRFLLRSLETVPAVIVYPVRCVGGIAVVTLVGVLLFGEKLKRRQWMALGAVCFAMVLLNI